MANAFADNIGSFEEFQKKFGSKKPQVIRSTEKELDINLEIKKATKILDGFTPPKK